MKTLYATKMQLRDDVGVVMEPDAVGWKNTCVAASGFAEQTGKADEESPSSDAQMEKMKAEEEDITKMENDMQLSIYGEKSMMVTILLKKLMEMEQQKEQMTLTNLMKLLHQKMMEKMVKDGDEEQI